MRVDLRDVQEALYQAPGAQVAELGNALSKLRETIMKAASVDAHRGDLGRRLQFLAERAAEIEPVIELLHGFAEAKTLRQGLLRRDRASKATPFMKKVQPAYAGNLLVDLAEARKEHDKRKAANIRDLIAMYVKESPIPAVRDVLVDGLRADALAHGETRSDNYIGSIEDLRQELLSCVPD